MATSLTLLSLFSCVLASDPAAPAMPTTLPTARPELPPWPKFEDVTKDMKSHEGLFTLWYYPESARDKDQERLLCQIPSSFLGQKFMVSASMSGGGFMTGFPLDEHVVLWELRNKQLLLIEPQTRFVVDDKATVGDAVRRTYPDRIRAAVPLVTKSPSGDPLIELGPLLKGGIVDLSWMSTPFFGRSGGGAINPALSRWTEKKSFELNVEIGVELAVSRAYPSGSFDKRMIHFSIWKLPQTDYQPRVADDRVGYFLTANQDWNKPTDSRDLFNRYIDRWHLVKRDPSLAKCEPKQPIVFYIEKTVPVRYRKAIREGILEWNKAYEKVGFVDAIQVRQQTDDNEWKDLDPEDMRYSFFRWIVTGAGFAMGPHRSNPFTGQIYDADIIFDDSMVRFEEMEARQMLPSSLVELKMSDPAMRRFLSIYPEWLRPGHSSEWLVLGRDENAELRRTVSDRLDNDGIHCCDYARGMIHQLAVARAVLADQPREVIDRLVQEVVKEVACHEVGHTLGLRHNFKASSIYSIDEIKKRRTTNEPLSGSIMDYNPLLFFTEKPTEGAFVTQTLGPWDYWAIEYGYCPADASYKPQGLEKKDTPPVKQPETVVAAKPTPTVKAPATEVPPDVMAKLPPNVKEVLQSATVKEMLAAKEKEAAKPEQKPSRAPMTPEQTVLRAIASRAAEPDLAYATDEDTTTLGVDPRTNRFDAGDDPIAWARERINLIDKRLANLLEWGVKDGESWYYLRTTFTRLLFEKTFVLDYVGRYVGGQYTSRSHRGDPGEKAPFVPVDAQTQQKAMATIEQSLFQDSFFAVSPDVLNHLTVSRWYHEDARVTMKLDFPVHEMISMLQWWNLVDRLMPGVLQRIQDAEMKTAAKDRFTVAEYIQRLQKACWQDAVDAARRAKGPWTDASPYVSDTRRSLQRGYLNIVEPMVRMQPGMMLSPDLHAMLQRSLHQLSRGIGEVLAKGGPPLDFGSEAHLASCQSRIDRMLAPQLQEYEFRRYTSTMYGYDDNRQPPKP